MKQPNNGHGVRWRVLTLACVVLLGENFCYDLPAMLHDQLQDYSGMKNDEFPWFFSALYSAYSFPNLIIPLFSGWMMDKAPMSAAIVALSTMSFLGQFLTAWGIIGKASTLAIVGRVVFGVGTESMGVAQSIILTHFFTGKEMAFALALNVSASRLGTILNNWASPYMSKSLGVPATFICGSLCCLVSVICAVELARTISTEEDRMVRSPDHNARGGFSAVRMVRKQFWIVACIAVAGYCSVIPFTTVFMASRPVGVSEEVAGQIISVVYITSAAVTPLIGSFVDRFGRSTYVLVASCLLLALAHSMYPAYGHVLVMGLLGVGYAGLVAAVWPLVPLTVSESRIGFAYGMVTALQNFGLTLAYIKSETGTYYGSRWLFVGTSLLTVALSSWLASGDLERLDPELHVDDHEDPEERAPVLVYAKME